MKLTKYILALFTLTLFVAPFTAKAEEKVDPVTYHEKGGDSELVVKGIPSNYEGTPKHGLQFYNNTGKPIYLFILLDGNPKSVSIPKNLNPIPFDFSNAESFENDKYIVLKVDSTYSGDKPLLVFATYNQDDVDLQDGEFNARVFVSYDEVDVHAVKDVSTFTEYTIGKNLEYAMITNSTTDLVTKHTLYGKLKEEMNKEVKEDMPKETKDVAVYEDDTQDVKKDNTIVYTIVGAAITLVAIGTALVFFKKRK